MSYYVRKLKGIKEDLEFLTNKLSKSIIDKETIDIDYMFDIYNYLMEIKTSIK